MKSYLEDSRHIEKEKRKARHAKKRLEIIECEHTHI